MITPLGVLVATSHAAVLIVFLRNMSLCRYCINDEPQSLNPEI